MHVADTNSIDQAHFRSVLGNFATGVVAVASMDDTSTPVGMAIGSFTSVSLDPPLVAFFPDKGSTTFPAIARSGRFCASILSSDQQDVCQRLASKGVDKFATIAWTPTYAGTPRIEGALGWIDCDIEAISDAGDHYMVLGRVRELKVESDAEPLVFFKGRFAVASEVGVPASRVRA